MIDYPIHYSSVRLIPKPFEFRFRNILEEVSRPSLVVAVGKERNYAAA